jgi:hypothetical protein
MAQSLLLTWGFPEFTKRELALGLAAILLIVIANRILYAVHLSFFHPLAQFPGPPKAARSRRYIFRITDSEFPEEILESIHENYREYWLLAF